MLVEIEARILIFPGTDFHFPSTSVPPGTFLGSVHMSNIPPTSHSITLQNTELIHLMEVVLFPSKQWLWNQMAAVNFSQTTSQNW